MRDCVASRLRLPDLKGIRVDNISNKDIDLASFLSECTPARLELFLVNYDIIDSTWIKSKFYTDAFSRAAASTTKEVFFSYIDFSAEDLQTLVKAACNVERIVFRWCCVHCSSGLDFGADLSYNTKFISFQGWGNKYQEDRMTDWRADPSKFSLVVDAISSSGLKTSLNKISIYGNNTLSASKVQEELNTKGMLHISVIDDNPAPLSS